MSWKELGRFILKVLIVAGVFVGAIAVAQDSTPQLQRDPRQDQVRRVVDQDFHNVCYVTVSFAISCVHVP